MPARLHRHAPIDLPATDEAVIQIRAARTSGIRGAFAVHCWLVLKAQGATAYERWDVVGRRARTGRIGLQRNVRPPHEGWAGRRTRLVHELRGVAAQAALPRVAALIETYPQRRRYRSWPGPNCNSFVAHLARSVPGLATALPPLAIGKDWLPDRMIARAPSGTGWQLSLGGLFSVLVAGEEGIEVGLLGLVVGCRPRPLRLVLPAVGVWGPREVGTGLNAPFSPMA